MVLAVCFLSLLLCLWAPQVYYSCPPRTVVARTFGWHSVVSCGRLCALFFVVLLGAAGHGALSQRGRDFSFNL